MFPVSSHFLTTVFVMCTLVGHMQFWIAKDKMELKNIQTASCRLKNSGQLFTWDVILF